MTHQPNCTRCNQPATMWSGVEDWKDEQGRWIGFCSRTCQNAWLNGDKEGKGDADA